MRSLVKNINTILEGLDASEVEINTPNTKNYVFGRDVKKISFEITEENRLVAYYDSFISLLIEDVENLKTETTEKTIKIWSDAVTANIVLR